ncbi:MAG: DUF935 family protein, partial [Ignavibacteria bacterium]|nr:DUF935 family protein [Ignavibacteria bacterium]
DKEEIRRCQEIKERLNNTNYPDAIKCAMAGVIYGHSVCLPHWELNQYNQYFPRFEDISFVHFVPKDGHLKMIVDSGNTDVFITIGNNSAIVGFNEPVSIAQRLDQSKGPVLLDIDEDNLLTVISNPFTGVIKNYIGGLMRSGLYLTLLKHYDIMDWAKFNELFGMPLRVGKFDPLMSNEQAIAILKTAVQNLGVDAAAVIDKTTEIEFVDGKAKSSTDSYEHFCQYVETKQSLLLLGQTLSNQVNSKFGSRALGNTYNLVREDKLYSDMLKVIPYMKKIVLKDYFYNYGIPPKGLNPRFTFKTEEGEDLEKLAGVVSRLTSAGLPISKEWAYTTFNVEAPKSDKDTFGGSVNPFGL